MLLYFKKADGSKTIYKKNFEFRILNKKGNGNLEGGKNHLGH